MHSIYLTILYCLSLSATKQIEHEQHLETFVCYLLFVISDFAIHYKNVKAFLVAMNRTGLILINVMYIVAELHNHNCKFRKKYHYAVAFIK